MLLPRPRWPGPARHTACGLPPAASAVSAGATWVCAPSPPPRRAPTPPRAAPVRRRREHHGPLPAPVRPVQRPPVPQQVRALPAVPPQRQLHHARGAVHGGGQQPGGVAWGGGRGNNAGVTRLSSSGIMVQWIVLQYYCPHEEARMRPTREVKGGRVERIGCWDGKQRSLGVVGLEYGRRRVGRWGVV